jgi:hypothetical protein
VIGDSFGADLIVDGTRSGRFVGASKEASAGGEETAGDVASPGASFLVGTAMPNVLFGDAEFAVDGTNVGGSLDFSKLASGGGDVEGVEAGAVLAVPGKRPVGAAVTAGVLGAKPEADGTGLSGVA